MFEQALAAGVRVIVGAAGVRVIVCAAGVRVIVGAAGVPVIVGGSNLSLTFKLIIKIFQDNFGSRIVRPH